MKIKDAITLGFGFAFGLHLFNACHSAFKAQLKKLSPDLYAKYCKESE